MPASTQLPLLLHIQRSPSQPGAYQEPPTPNQANNSTPAGDNRDLKGVLTRYTVDFMINARDLHFDAGSDGARHGKVETTLLVYSIDGKPLNWVVRQINLDVDAAHDARIEANGIRFRLEIDAPKDGVVSRSGVYDLGSSMVETLETPIDSILTPSPTASYK